MKIFLSQLNPIVGDIFGNTQKVLKTLQKAKKERVDIVLFPEMILCGYPTDDLLLFPEFISEIEKQTKKIASATIGLFVVVGTVRKEENKLFNTTAIFCDGKFLGYKDKTLLPSYEVFNESRYFKEGKKQKIWEFKGKRIGVFVSEDVWEHAKILKNTYYERDPVEEMKQLKPDIVLISSASPYFLRKKEIREKVYQRTTQTLECPVFVVNQVGGHEQLIFDGYSLYLNEKGEICQEAKGFEEDDMIIDLKNSFLSCPISFDYLHDLYNALVLGVKDYFYKNGFKKAVLGISGGIDSALSCCITVDALGKENVLALNMPTRFSLLEGMEDAKVLSENLGIKMIDMPIDHVYQIFLDLLSPIFSKKCFGTAEENIQARIRAMILMAVSNKLGHVVLSTGNKSEMAMGYCTIYGDMCGGFGVLIDVPKTYVYRLAKYLNKQEKRIPENIIRKEPSAELKQKQKDKDDLPEYSVVDKVLKNYVEEHMSKEEIVKKEKLNQNLVEELIHKIHLAEFKRRQGPIGVRVTKQSFGRGRFFPIVQKWVD